MAAAEPRNAEQVRAAILDAGGAGATIEILGHGTKRGLGRPVNSGLRLDLSGLAGIGLYEPDELVLTAAAGTPILEIETLLRQNRQQLAFEPPDFAPLYGAAAGRGTLGGVLAGNLAGPRRISAGAARDHFLGVQAVAGNGVLFKSGGRVVKNVTGYDLCRLLAGSHGTLAAMTEVTVKVLPAPETSATLVLFGLDDTQAVAALARALGSPFEVSGAAHLPPRTAGRTGTSLARQGVAATVIRLEGVAPSVKDRFAELARMFAGLPQLQLEAAESVLLWQEVRDVRLLLADADAYIWRTSVAPTAGPEFAGIVAAAARAQWLFDWGGGLVWLALAAEGPVRMDAGAALVRQALAQAGGGHATLMRAPEALRAGVPVFEPQPEALAALTRRVKESFDPDRLLNPGRMFAGV
jgi:glycolate oxidase FAD binding subunit